MRKLTVSLYPLCEALDFILMNFCDIAFVDFFDRLSTSISWKKAPINDSKLDKFILTK